MTKTEKKTKKLHDTEIVCIVDRSGSMASIRDDAIGGFNTFLEAQKSSASDAKMTVCLFDDQYDVLYDGVPVGTVKPFDTTTYVPRGMTALYDAIGKTVSTIDTRPEKNSKVLVVILTDGQENSSREYRRDAVTRMIEDHTKSGWEFLYLSASPTAFTDGGSMGIAHSNVFQYKPTGKGMSNAYRGANALTASYCCSGGIDKTTSETVRKQYFSQ